MNFYAVKKGRNIGIYKTWGECQEQVNSYKGAIYKKFTTLEAASNFINDTNLTEETEEKDKVIYVDGGFNKNTGSEAWASIVNGYSVDLIPYIESCNLIPDMTTKEVTLPSGKRKIIVTKFEGVTHQNNGAELLALVVGLRLAINLIKRGIPVTKVFSDSQVVLYWSIRLKEGSNFDPRKIAYINELISLRREFESFGGQVVKISGDKNLADLGWH